MKLFSLFIFIIFLCLVTSFLPNVFFKSPLFWFDNDDKYLTNAERIVNKILYQTALTIEKKYKFKPAGTIISMPSCVVKKLGLAFDPWQQLSKEQLRELTVQFATELLHQININEEVQPFLIKRPFTIENVEIVIYNADMQGYSIYDPEIAVAHLAQGIIIYRTDDPDVKFRYKNRYEETYEEALQLIHKKD